MELGLIGPPYMDPPVNCKRRVRKDWAHCNKLD
jgi:hypothetical protein